MAFPEILKIVSSNPSCCQVPMRSAARPSFHKIPFLTGRLCSSSSHAPQAVPAIPTPTIFPPARAGSEVTSWIADKTISHNPSIDTSDQPGCSRLISGLRLLIATSLQPRSKTTHLIAEVPTSIPSRYCSGIFKILRF